MTTLQEFIDSKFINKESKEKIKNIALGKDLNRISKEITDKEIEGGKLDLSSYNIRKLMINSNCLKSSLTELVLSGSSNLETLVIVNSPGLTSLDISGCSNLTVMNINGMELIEASHKLEVKG
jgi:hypothetical protein